MAEGGEHKSLHPTHHKDVRFRNTNLQSMRLRDILSEHTAAGKGGGTLFFPANHGYVMEGTTCALHDVSYTVCLPPLIVCTTEHQTS
jgi:endo-1,4-beta-D-glucanase Y